ncbi:206_t:CDS:2 [Gigaspora margarita]|uniref:206_t:CDS:1 n=1 Tax=Gigaspora margarita TaxID=4874 RepID=A0ABN7W5N3_GIGMA|nr:206_t:CDS:2 [Gigaspora margarita]
MTKIILGGISLISMDLIIAECRRRYNEHAFFNTFLTGSKNTLKNPPSNFISREEIVNKIKPMLTPQPDSSFYQVISGSHGVGKSTIVSQAAREVGRGVIYVDIPPDNTQFGNEFAKALNISFDEHITFMSTLFRKIWGIPLESGVSQDPKWTRALARFQHGAEAYLKAYGKPAVIIYDNASRLTHEILDILQNDAKENANYSNYISLFVTSEGSVPMRMQGRSAWSRAESIFEIPDLPKDKSMDFLDKNGIPLKEAEQFYNLIGGRIIQLKRAVKLFKTRSFDETKNIFMDDQLRNFTRAEILPGGLYHNVASKIIKILLEKGQIEYIDFQEIVNDKKVADILLDSNIFSLRPSGSTINFESKLVESFIREKLCNRPKSP